jgi:hypothetical protein
MLQAWLQAAIDLNAKIFSCWNKPPESIRIEIEVYLIISLNDFLIHEHVKIAKVNNHSGGGVDRAGDCNIQNVVMAMSVGVIALPVDSGILRGAQQIIVQAVRSGKSVPAGKLDHYSPK